jgi:hypothetical protein
MARQMANVPDDWEITIVVPKPTEIEIACAAGPITTEMVQSVQRRMVTALNLIPKQAACPKSVMVNVIHHHIDENRKPAQIYIYRVTSRIRRTETRTTREMDQRGTRLSEPWCRRAQKMSTKESDYLWFTGNEFHWCSPRTIKKRSYSMTNNDHQLKQRQSCYR